MGKTKRASRLPRAHKVILRALQSAGVEFIDENGGGPGVRLKKRQQKKAQRTA
jgi:hypothetical protein